MNNFIKIGKQNKALYKSIKKNYGVSIYTSKIVLNKLNFSKSKFNSKSVNVLTRFIDLNYSNYNRFLKLFKKSRIDKIRKQSSWKGARFRQGLAVNGQRTHTNARTSKTLVQHASIFNI